jgi:hypothetical protein
MMRLLNKRKLGSTKIMTRHQPKEHIKLSFKKHTNEWCGRNRFGGWTDADIHQMIDWCVSIRQDQVDKKYLHMEKA